MVGPVVPLREIVGQVDVAIISQAVRDQQVIGFVPTEADHSESVGSHEHIRGKKEHTT